MNSCAGELPTYRISSFIGCVSASASFVLGAKPQKHWIFHAEAPNSRTGKSDFERCIAMNDEAINWDDVPVVITKDQLYRICHINKYRPVPAPKRENPLRVYGQENTLL